MHLEKVLDVLQTLQAADVGEAQEPQV